MSAFLYTWYGVLIVGVPLYLLIGAYWGGRAQDAGWTTDGDTEFAGFLVTIGWVFVGIYMVLHFIGMKPRQLGLTYSKRKAERTGIPAPGRTLHGNIVTVREDYDYDYRR